jgi:hypothetical protein
MVEYGLLKLEIIKTLSSSVLAKAYDLKVNEYSFICTLWGIQKHNICSMFEMYES